MGAMSVDVPDGTTVQIFVGRAPLLALPDATGENPLAVASHRRTRPVTMTLIGIAILGGGFLLGQHTRLSSSATAATSGHVNFAAPAPVTRAFPDHALAAAPAVPAPPSQMPPAFTQQLQQSPTVVPPPGRPPAPATPAKNPFGLDH